MLHQRRSIQYLLLVSLIGSVPLLRADSLTTQVNCESTGTPTVTGANTCSVTGSAGNAADALYLTTTYPASPSGYFTITLTETGTATSALANTNIGGGGILSSAALDLSLATAGAPRAGYLELVTTDGAVSSGDVAQNLSYSIGDFYQTMCSPSIEPLSENCGPSFPRLYAADLGVPFQLQLAYTDTIDTAEGTSTVGGTATLAFRFLESDQVTPVAIGPEPSAWGLIAAGLVCLAFGLWNRSKVRSARAGGDS